MAPLTSRFSNISGGSGGSGFGRRRPRIVITAANAPPGTFIGGGYLICRSSGVSWIVSPYSAEVSRNWHTRADANTRAQQVSGCTGWFVPSVSQLSNPGFVCRNFWDAFSPWAYWSDTQIYSGNARRVFFPGYVETDFYGCKNTVLCVRSFRCVTY